ncbi:hypothetical protein NDU88_002938 [Pleurodeles waltl]|uniref:Uncharacterized protein n=1 Tax=Pleurodeles waltl TaxID=8319 RepID=A0AAV7WMN7_PLEWA|nr:hypothetical protein NDU88_002938 [Pleurodeles waltl]
MKPATLPVSSSCLLSTDPCGAFDPVYSLQHSTARAVVNRGRTPDKVRGLPVGLPQLRKAARESQPPSPVPASPTARKTQPRDPASKSPPTPRAEGCTPAWPVTTTKGAAAGAIPQGLDSGRDSLKTPPQELAERGSADSPGEPRKLQRENSTGAGKRAVLHTEVRAAGKRELEKSTERLAAAAPEAARQRSSAVVAPRNTVTTKLHMK